MRRFVFALAVIAASGAAVSAQDVEGAEAAVRAYTVAAVAGDWDTAAVLMDPIDLARFRDLALLIVESDPMGAAVLGIDPDSPPEALLATFVGVALEENPFMEGAMASAQTTILGTILEGDSLAHVVARSDMMLFGENVSSIETTSTRWDGSRWLVKLSSDIEAMIVGMEAALENPALFGLEDEIIELDTAQPRDPKKQ